MKNFALALALAVCAALFINHAGAKTLATLVQFSGSGSGPFSGQNPVGSLTLSGTTLYGMTYGGGVNGDGNVFSVGMDGATYQNLVSFTGMSGTASGFLTRGSLIASGSTLYGMTAEGGPNGDGNVFSVGTNGTNYQNLLSFGGTASGFLPDGSLLASGSTLYGMTALGGANQKGNLFSVGMDGTNYQNLVSFTGGGGTAIGSTPEGSLIASGGTLYGMTEDGGPSRIGNVFSVGMNGTNYRNLVTFTGTGGTASGYQPFGSLIASGGTLYGMTYAGGANGDGNVFSVGMDGTHYQNLLAFTGAGGTASGANPVGSLILSGTTLYGLTSKGGANGDGNIYGVGINGFGYQDLYDFTGGTDGRLPQGDLLASGGSLFGMTTFGGTNGDGTIFALTLLTPEPCTLASRVRCGSASGLSLAEAACAAAILTRGGNGIFLSQSSFLKMNTDATSGWRQAERKEDARKEYIRTLITANEH